MRIDQTFLNSLFEQAKQLERLRVNYDLRTSENEGSQRMLNALLPGTEVTIHRHTSSTENIICLCGKIDIILFKEQSERVCIAEGFDRGRDAQDVVCQKVLVEAERIQLCPAEGSYACVVPVDTWHTVQVHEPSAIYEAKDGKYGEDGSENFNGTLVTSSTISSSTSFQNSLGDLKKNIEYLIGKERAEGNQEELTAEHISKVLGADIAKVEKVMKEIWRNF